MLIPNTEKDYYQSLIKKLKVVMKPGGKVMNGAGEVVITLPDIIKFENYFFVPETDEQAEFLDKHKAKRSSARYWKVTQVDLAKAKAYASDLEELNKKHAQMNKDLTGIIGTQDAGTGAKTVTGMANTDPAKFREELINKNKLNASQEGAKKEPVVVEDVKPEPVVAPEEDLVDHGNVNEPEEDLVDHGDVDEPKKESEKLFNEVNNDALVDPAVVDLSETVVDDSPVDDNVLEEDIPIDPDLE